MEERIAESAQLQATAALLEHGRRELGKIIAGQSSFIDEVLVTVLCGGHALVEGVPGIAKTLSVKLLGRVLGLDFQRVQSTPDLMPADILGTNIFRLATQEFILHRGPVFSSFLLVDEINRMPPRTQSALLECMEERQVTIDGVRYELSPFFTVFATQNPIDFEGTYPLPEAQLDRFLMKLKLGYPSLEDERIVLERHHHLGSNRGFSISEVAPAPEYLLGEAQREIREVRIEPSLYDYLLQIVRRSREWPTLVLGASPRAAVSLMLVAQAWAAVDGRSFLIPDDVKRAALPVLRHRILLKPEAELEGADTDRILHDILAAVPVPALASDRQEPLQ
ncbi:MAG TPA: MoxR family ATPase [Acidobacteriaceae bacterium]|nr:MoxR family ATPase [Acidobacteriaceae bacterium]